MTTKTMTTKSGKKIEVELVREVQDKTSYMDGQRSIVGREIVEYTNITFRDANGKYLASGKKIEEMYGNNVAEMKAKGAVARIGEAAVGQEIVDLINAAFTELEAENPKSEEYLEIKKATAKAIADHDDWYNSAEEVAYRKFTKDMEREDSDY